VKFVVDAQLPPALARLLREAGGDAFAVREIGLREASDAEIWRYAVQRQAAIIKKLIPNGELRSFTACGDVMGWERIPSASDRLTPL